MCVELLAHYLHDQGPGSGSVVKVYEHDLLPGTEGHLATNKGYGK